MINTIDLDNISKEMFERIIKKIEKKSCCLELKWKFSDSKGYHIYIICDKICDLCRFVFDDERRYNIDIKKDIRFQNLLFSEKEYFRGNINSIAKTKC